MEEYTKGVVEEYIAYQRRVLKTLLDRGVYTPEGIEDHIRSLRESIEEDLDSNKAYALLKMEMDVKKGKVSIGHCQNEGAATKLKQMIESTFEKAQVEIHKLRGLCSFYAEKGGLLVGFEKY